MDTQNEQIAIESIEDTPKKVILKTAGAKWYFWKTKKDGNETKAFQQFQQFGFKSGDTVEAAVKSEQRTFTNEKGKEITYMDRNIAFFLVQDNVPQATRTPSQPQTPQTGTMTLELRLDALEARVTFLENPPKTSDDVYVGDEKVPF